MCVCQSDAKCEIVCHDCSLGETGAGKSLLVKVMTGDEAVRTSSTSAGTAKAERYTTGNAGLVFQITGLFWRNHRSLLEKSQVSFEKWRRADSSPFLGWYTRSLLRNRRSLLRNIHTTDSRLNFVDTPGFKLPLSPGLKILKSPLPIEFTK